LCVFRAFSSRAPRNPSKEYIAIEKLPLNRTGFEVKGQAIAFMVVTDEYMVQVRDALKPHRGELYVEEQ
jgi:hypothetical protein